MAQAVSSKTMRRIFLSGQITVTAAGFTFLIGRIYSEIDALPKTPHPSMHRLTLGHASVEATSTGRAGGEQV